MKRVTEEFEITPESLSRLRMLLAPSSVAMQLVESIAEKLGWDLDKHEWIDESTWTRYRGTQKLYKMCVDSEGTKIEEGMTVATIIDGKVRRCTVEFLSHEDETLNLLELSMKREIGSNAHRAAKMLVIDEEQR